MLKVNSNLMMSEAEEMSSMAGQFKTISENVSNVNSNLKWNIAGSSIIQTKLSVCAANLTVISEKATKLSSVLSEAVNAYIAAEEGACCSEDILQKAGSVGIVVSSSGSSAGTSSSINNTVSNSKSGDDYLQEITDRYSALLKANGRSTYVGACAAYVTDQLLYEGVISSADGRVAAGKDYYSTWSSRTTTSTGYNVESYGGSNALSALLAAHEGETLENIVVSFDATSSNSYGHVIYISAIKDGYVYFSDSSSSLHINGQAYGSGEARSCTVEEFLSLSSYSGTNGVIYFYQ